MSNGTLELYMGRAGTGKTYGCFSRIKEILVKGEQGAGQIILLVPDPSAYRVERALAEFMPRGGFHSVLVVGFQRLSHHVFQAMGEEDKDLMSDTGRNLMIRSILKSREKDLDIFRQVSRQPNFSQVIQSLMKECHAFQISPEQMEEALENMARRDAIAREKNEVMGERGEGILYRKWKDLSLIAKDYTEALQEACGTMSDRMDRLCELLPDCPLTKDSYIFIDGFHWFTPQQIKIIQALIDNGRHTVMTVTAPPPGQGLEAYQREGTLFYRTYETYKELSDLYGDCLTVTPFTTHYRGAHDHALTQLEEGFFRVPAKVQEENLQIPLYAAYNRKREVDFICRTILSHMEGESPWRFKDFAIMLRDMHTYRDILEKALQSYEIPYFIDQANPMVTHPLAELIEGIFHVAMTNYGHEAIFALLKTDMFPMERRHVDDLENYCLKYGVRQGHWDDEPWTICDDGEEALLEEINRTRHAFIMYTKDFVEAAKENLTGEAWSQLVYDFIEGLHIDETLNKWYEEALGNDDIREAKAHGQMYGRLINLLDEVYKACGKEHLTLEEAANVFKEGLSDITYSLVPPTLDHVIVTSIERSYANDYPVLFLPGLNDGIFPRRMGDEGILRDRERELLRKYSVTLAAGALTQAFNENFLFYLACTRASKKLILSYAGADDEGGAMESSLTVRRLVQSGYCTEPKPIPLEIIKGTEDDYIWRPKQSLQLLSAQLQYIIKGETISSIWWHLLDWGNREKPHLTALALRGKDDRNEMVLLRQDLIRALLMPYGHISGSVSRLELYSACPFKFFAQYVVKAEERPVKTFDHADSGTFLHETMRYMGEKLLAEKRQWRNIKEEDLTAFVRDSADEVSRTLSGGYLEETAYMKDIKERHIRILEAAVKRMRQWSEASDFDMYSLEQDFGKGPSDSDITSHDSWAKYIIRTPSGGELHLKGQIDRIDRWQNDTNTYATVIDYKSSTHYLDAQSIYYGLKLQLMTYLMVVEAFLHKDDGQTPEGSVIPSALIYTFLKMDPLKCTTAITAEEAALLDGEEAKMKNKGYFNKDKDVLTALYHNFAVDNPFVPIKLKKDGDFQKTSLKYVKGAIEFDTLVDYTRYKLGQIGDGIMKGQFPIAPYHLDNRTACSYCPYGGFCRFDVTHKDSQYRHLEVLNEEKAMERISHKVLDVALREEE